MKIDTSNAVTQIEATTGEVREFSIEVNPVAFSLLSQKLYSRPVDAVIRELICNAYDAHVAAGTLDKAITVGLPTSLMPEFTVSDFGTGLSDSDVMRLYTTFFASNKRDSNSSIGGFGLGSKSPFAVADSFTVESRFNGVKSTYLATKDSGAPKLVRMASVATSEPSGMTIRVPVKHNFDDWHYKAKAFAGFFGHPIQGLGEFINHYTDTSNTYIKGVLFGKSSGAYIRVGNTVTYPYSPVDGFFSNTIIDMPIGSLTIAPTREDLVFDAPTLAALAKREQETRAAIVDEWKAMFPNIDTDYATPAEATMAAVKAAKEYLPQRVSFLVKQLKWNGLALDPDSVHINNTNARLGKDFQQITVPESDLRCFRVRIKSNDYAHLESVGPETMFGSNSATGIVRFVDFYSMYFNPVRPWHWQAGTYDALLVVEDETVTDEKSLLKRIRSAPVVANRINHTRFCRGMNVVLIKPYIIDELAAVYWLKDWANEPYLKDKVVKLSDCKEYVQPKQTRVGTAPKRTNFHEFVNVVGVDDFRSSLELDYAKTFGTEPLLFVPLTYSGLFMEQKNRLARAADVLKKPIYCFMDKARKAYDAAPPHVKAKWLNLLDADNVVNNVLLTNPKFKAEVYKQTSILPELPEWFKHHAKLDDVKVKNFMVKVNSTLSTEYTYNFEYFYEGIPDNAVVQAVKVKVEALCSSMRASLNVELTEALKIYQPYLQSISCRDDESVVRLVNLVYNSVNNNNVTKGSK